MYVHALTCRHPCQRGGARGSHARVDLGDLLTARMSGAGCAGRSIIQQPPLGRRPSPLPQLQPQPPRANLQTVPSGACVQHLLARIVGCSVAHQRARPPCARQHIAWSRRWGMRLGLWLWLGLRMRRRCGDGGGGAAVGCRRLPSATRPAAERPAELCASGIPSLLTVMAVSARNFCVKFKMVFRGLPRACWVLFFSKNSHMNQSEKILQRYLEYQGQNSPIACFVSCTVSSTECSERALWIICIIFL